MAGTDASAREAGQAVILRVRQLADALLRQTNLVATDLVVLYDDRADLT